MQGEQENTTQPTLGETMVAKGEEVKSAVEKEVKVVAAEWDAGVTKAQAKAKKARPT